MGAKTEVTGERTAWQARAERLESALGVMLGVFGPYTEPGPATSEEYRAHSSGWEALHAPHPSPSRLLEVLRAAAKWKLWHDRYRETNSRGDRIRETEARDHLWWSLDSLDPEERAALAPKDDAATREGPTP